MKELFCLLYCFVLFKRVEPFSYVRIRDKDFEPADVKFFFPSYSTLLYNEFVHWRPVRRDTRIDIREEFFGSDI